MKHIAILFACVAVFGISPDRAAAHTPHVCPDTIPDLPTISGHMEQADISAGRVTLQEVLDHGEALFAANLNTCDGQGRPATTGAGDKRAATQPAFIRTSAPEANSCAGCHNMPFVGGAGDIVANVFVLAQAADPVLHLLDPTTFNERNTLGMFGSGAIELLAREMTEDLQEQRRIAPDGAHVFMTKGVSFPVVIENGEVVSAEGVDTDLVVKPFHQSGSVISLREFTVNAFNHHHGLQAEERFDLSEARGLQDDHDEDGVVRELTIGDITAATLWQATLPIPGRVLPKDKEGQRAVKRGAEVFEELACSSCHMPSMTLDFPVFTEPSGLNPVGTHADQEALVAIDLVLETAGPKLEVAPMGGVIVRAYTDFKRHNLCDPADAVDAVRHFCNETLDQGRPAQDGRPGAEFFLTRRLWDVGNSAPYGHRGDLTTIAEAIQAHGGEARAMRDGFMAAPRADQLALVRFLKSLQVLPPSETD